jgi:uncharacterized membrane protein YjjB (DUF3815 family)
VVPGWLKIFWNAATVAAILGAAILACLVAYGIRVARSRPLASGSVPAMIVIVGSGVAYALLAALALRFFYDRYVMFLLLTVVLIAGFLFACTSSDQLSKRESAFLVLVLALEATFTVLATRDYLEWNRTRWTATSVLLTEGVPRTSIDGGYEFNGWLGYDPAYQSKPGKSPYWVTDDEYIIASGPLSGYSIIRAYPIRRLLTGRDSRLVVLRRDPK